jgi:hypothetical protein
LTKGLEQFYVGEKSMASKKCTHIYRIAGYFGGDIILAYFGDF